MRAALAAQETYQWLVDLNLPEGLGLSERIILRRVISVHILRDIKKLHAAARSAFQVFKNIPHPEHHLPYGIRFVANQIAADTARNIFIFHGRQTVYEASGAK
jgi:hypothetical protein